MLHKLMFFHIILEKCHKMGIIELLSTRTLQQSTVPPTELIKLQNILTPMFLQCSHKT